MNNLDEPRTETRSTEFTPPAGPAQMGAGYNVASRRSLPYKSTILAGVMSIVPGLGQVYTGAYQQGFINALVIAGVISLLASGQLTGLEPLLAIFLVFFWFYTQLDAIRRVQRYNRALDGAGSLTELEATEAIGAGGNVFAGVVMVILGGLALARTVFDVPMEWLADWWPIGLIAAGIWLIMKARNPAD